MTDDLLDRLAAYRPVDPDGWSADSHARLRATLVGPTLVGDAPNGDVPDGDAPDLPRLRFVAPTRVTPLPVAGRSRRRLLAPILAAAAVVALMSGILVAVTSRNGEGDAVGSGGTGGAGFDPPAGLSTSAGLNAGQYYAQVTEQLDLDATGAVDPSGQDAMTMRDYVAQDGTLVSIRSGQQNGCLRFAPGGSPSLAYPTLDFFASLPTDPDRLGTYVAARVQGSSSHDEAVFVSVGDLLRTDGGLASPALRAAFLAVISRLPEVTLHDGVTDQQGRDAIRADFVDQRIRPGEVHSYFFGPSDFRFLEESQRSNGQPSVYSGPSPAYSAAGSGVDPDRLAGAGFVSVVTSQRVVDDLPAAAKNCSDR